MEGKYQIREAEMRAELSAKDRMIEELLNQRDELQERLRESERLSQTETEGQRPMKRTRDCRPFSAPLKEEPQKDSLVAEQNRRRMERAIAESYEEGYRQARLRATLEEEGLMKQLQMLQDMQETLRSGMKVEKSPRICYDDL